MVNSIVPGKNERSLLVKSRCALVIAIILLWAFSFPVSFAQNHSPLFQHPGSADLISLHVDFAYNSNALTAEFTKAFYQGAFLDDALKQAISGRLTQSNRFGTDAAYGLFYRGKLFSDSSDQFKRLDYFISTQAKHHLDIGFKDVLFNNYFFGNKYYAGDTVDLGPSKFRLLFFKQVQLGIAGRLPLAGGVFRWAAGLSFFISDNHLSINIQKARLYTDPQGLFIDLNMDFEIKRSRDILTRYFASNGLGAGLDTYFQYQSKTGNDKISFEMNDLGFLRFDNNSIIEQNDTSIHFEGFEIENILDIDSVFSSLSADSLIEVYGTTSSNKAYSIFLPAKFHLSYSHRFNEKWTVRAGVVQRVAAAYLPLGYVGGIYSFNPGFSLKANLIYGGYGELMAGLELHKVFGKHIAISIGTDHLHSGLFKDFSNWQGGYLMITARF